MSDYYDDIPLEVRRRNWGWFGDPWPSGICENDDGSINWEMQTDFPEGETCLWCGETFQAGDQGAAVPGLGVGEVAVRHTHKECMLRQVVGSYHHLTSGCPGDGSCNHDSNETDISLREDALLVWNYYGFLKTER